MYKRFLAFMHIEPGDWDGFKADGGTEWLLFWAGYAALVVFGLGVFRGWL